MNAQPSNVFIDSNVMAQVGPPPGNATFQRLVDLVDYGRIRMITTKINKSELTRIHIASANKKLQPVRDPEFQRLMRRLYNVQIPPLDSQEISDSIRADVGRGVEAMFGALSAREIPLHVVDPNEIFEGYDKGTGLFDSKNKRNQFPDAFIFECLRSVARESPTLVVITNDGDFEGPVSDDPNMTLLKSIPDLFLWLDLQIDEPEADLIEFLQEHLAINQAVLDEVEQYDFEVGEGHYVDLTLDCFEDVIYTAFRQVRPGAPLLISVAARAYLHAGDRYSGRTSRFGNAPTADIAFHASVKVDDQGVPIELTDVQLFENTIRLDDSTIWFLYDYDYY